MGYKLSALLLIAVLTVITAPSAVAQGIGEPVLGSSDKCSIWQEQVVCNVDRILPLVSTRDNCKKHLIDPDYVLIDKASDVTSSEMTFCFSKASSVEALKFRMSNLRNFTGSYVAPLVLLSIILELPVYFILRFRDKKALKSVMLINFFSIPLVTGFIFLFPLDGILVWSLSTVFLVMFEASLFLLFNKGSDIGMLFKASLASNLLSTLVASFVTSFLIF